MKCNFLPLQNSNIILIKNFCYKKTKKLMYLYRFICYYIVLHTYLLDIIYNEINVLLLFYNVIYFIFVIFVHFSNSRPLIHNQITSSFLGLHRRNIPLQILNHRLAGDNIFESIYTSQQNFKNYLSCHKTNVILYQCFFNR